MTDRPNAPDTVLAMVRAQLSFRTKASHLALMIVAVGAIVALASILMTEPGLPRRTWWAMAAFGLLNSVWATYAGWVLSARRTMLSNHRVIAGRIAVAAAALFTLGSGALGAATGATAAYLAAAIGLVLTGFAAALLTRARRRHWMLQLRRDQLLAHTQDGGL